MKISMKGEYGLRAMLYMAMQGHREPVTSREIARCQSIPEPYLRQILARLARARLIRSSRGPQGGHALGRPAREISLREILLVLEGHTTSVDQILALPCNIAPGSANCAIRGVLLEVKGAVDRILEGTDLETLARRQADLGERVVPLPRDAASAGICGWPEAAGALLQGEPE